MPRAASNVYIVAEQGGPRKIGVSDSPEKRIVNLRSGRAPLSIVAIYPREAHDAGIVERLAHRLLKEKQVSCEWFAITNEQAVAAVREAIALVNSGDLSLLERELRTCSIDGCSKPVVGLGLCKLHYDRKKYGVAIDVNAPVRIRQSGALCSVDGCEEQYYATGLCRRHYQRRRNGKALEAPFQEPGLIYPCACSIDGCWRGASPKYGLCHTHKQRQERGVAMDTPIRIVRRQVRPSRAEKRGRSAPSVGRAEFSVYSPDRTASGQAAPKPPYWPRAGSLEMAAGGPWETCPKAVCHRHAGCKYTPCKQPSLAA
jgi:hypothetical protein